MSCRLFGITLKEATVKSKKAATTGAKPVANIQQVENPSPNTSLLEGTSDILDNLPFEACVELTLRLLTCMSFLPKGAALPRAVLKTLIFVTVYGSTP
jgi:hypothetical protein